MVCQWILELSVLCSCSFHYGMVVVVYVVSGSGSGSVEQSYPLIVLLLSPIHTVLLPFTFTSMNT